MNEAVPTQLLRAAEQDRGVAALSLARPGVQKSFWPCIGGAEQPLHAYRVHGSHRRVGDGVGTSP